MSLARLDGDGRPPGLSLSNGARPPRRLRRALVVLLTCAVTPFALDVPVSAQPTQAPPAKGPPATRVVDAPRRAWEFPADGVTFDSEFSGARLSACERLASDHYAIVTSPENRPINSSPWFAFRIRATTTKQITVRISCEGARLRYIPKISVDGQNWIALPSEAFTPGPNPDEGTLRLDAGPEPLWVAAQEIVSVEVLENWSRTLERLPFVTRAEIGRSLGNRPIHQLLIDATPVAPPRDAAPPPGLVVIVSRQHPPETTGSQSLMLFVEALLAESPRALEFRRHFAVLIVPLVNPDGVALGHWRHNLNGVDTNRDWGFFAQPETRVVRDAILAARNGRRQMLHLDFHSTHHDVFYTQTDEAVSSPAGFTAAWLAGIEQRVPAYKVNRSPNPTPTLNTSHNWAHRTFGIPTITYEVGDNTDRTTLRTVAAAAADSMMEFLLAAK